MKKTLMMLALLCCASCTAVNKAEELIGKVSAQVDNLKPKIEAASAMANTAIETAKAAKAQVEAKADNALNTLETKGAPVDGSAGDLLKWAAANPGDAAQNGGLLATALAALMLGYKRKKAMTALATVVKGVQDASPDAQANVKAAIKDAGGSESGVRELIRAVKKDVA